MSIGPYLGRFGKEHPELEEDEEYQKWIKQVKKAVLKSIQKQTGKKTEWVEGAEPDEQIGEELGSWSNLLQLQRYAAHIHFTSSPPDKPAEDDELDNDEYLMRYHEVMENESTWENKNLKFKHLIMTGDQIYFIPIDFPEPLLIEEEDEEELMSIGSSYQLYQELEEINKFLLMIGDYGQVGEDEAWKFYANEQDHWRFVKWVWIVLHWLAKESINKKLCIFFE
jgi:hypothetical protein